MDTHVFLCLSAFLVFFGLLSAAQAQQSSGYTFHKIVGPGSVDTNNATVIGTPNEFRAFRTDGTTVVFTAMPGSTSNGTYIEECNANWEIYKAPITGGSITPVVTPTTHFEATDVSANNAEVCSSPIISGANLVYGATYVNPSGVQRDGFYSIPLAGGTSVDLLALGDAIPGTSTTASFVRNGAFNSAYSTMFTVQNQDTMFQDGSFAFDANLQSDGSLGRLYYKSGSVYSGEAPETNQTCATNSLATMSPYAFSTDGQGYYTSTATFYGTATNPSAFSNFRTGVVTSTSPLTASCSSPFLFDPSPSTGAVLLPGAPTQPSSFTPAPPTVSSSAVIGSTTYFVAMQTLADGSAYSAILQGSGTTVTKFLSNRDTIPGITPVVTLCSGTLEYPTITSTVLSTKRYLVFQALQTTQDCSTLAYDFQGGVFAYDITTGTISPVYTIGRVPVAGDAPLAAVNGMSPGQLSADGHLLILSPLAFDTYNAASSTNLYSIYLPQLVTAVNLSPSASASTYAGSITLTAKVTPNTGAASSATGNVTFLDGTTTLGTAAIDSTGTAVYTANGLTSGAHSLSVVYAGDTLYMGATSAISTVTVARAATTLAIASSLKTVQSGGSVTLTATLGTALGGTPTGNIVFLDNGSTLATVALTGTNSAMYTTTALGYGGHVLTATYAGDTNFLSSATTTVATTNVTVPINITGAVTSSLVYGNTVVYKFTLASSNAAVTVAPSGVISFSLDGGTAVKINATVAQVSNTLLTAGAHTFSYTYAGDASYTSITTPITGSFTVTPAPLKVVATAATRAYGAANPTFTGTVTGLVYSDPITAGYATTATATSAVGTYPITPTLVDPSSRLVNYTVTNTAGTLLVTKAGTTLELLVPASAAVSTSVTLTAIAASATSGTPTGTVTFFSGQTVLGTGTLSGGVVTFSTSALPLGTATLSATYAGDTNFMASASTASSIVIGTPDYTITVAPPSATINAGQTATFVFTVTQLFGYSQPLTFACGSLPANATCTFTPNPLTPHGKSTATLVIATNVKSATLSLPGFPGKGLPIGGGVALAGLMLLPLLGSRKRLRQVLGSGLVAVCLSAALVVVSGCSSTPMTVYKTPDGTSTINVTASAGTGSAGHTASLSLVINN